MDYIQIISVVLAAAGVAFGVLQWLVARKQLRQSRQVAFEWKDVEAAAISLFGKVEEEVTPAAILCLNERASIPMGIGLQAVARDVPVFVGFYEGKRGVDIDVAAYYQLDTGRTGTLHLPRSVSYYKKKKLLVFTAYVHTGTTVIQVTNFLKKEGFEQLSSAALVAQRTSEKNFKCDFTYYYTENADFSFPWGPPP